jgi:hypothetical protein
MKWLTQLFSTKSLDEVDELSLRKVINGRTFQGGYGWVHLAAMEFGGDGLSIKASLFRLYGGREMRFK